VERIGKLYYLNKQRLLYEPSSESFQIADIELRRHILDMEDIRNSELSSRELNSAAHKALRSLSRHWFGLTLFLDNPFVPLDNNEAERLLRTSVVGRKNFYGSGSLKSGTMAECAYSILMTAEKNGLNPLTYLWSYLHACAENNGGTPENIERFLPWKATIEDIAAWKLPPTIA
jgi:transposase